MAYPPFEYADFKATGEADGPAMDEILPPTPNDTSPDLVHFDLDPSNSRP
jgi:hypothetical protein